MVGENIKKIRKSRRLTQKQLSEKAGISISYIQQLEYGIKENPSLETLTLIANVLNVNIQDLTEEFISKEFNSLTETQILSSDVIDDSRILERDMHKLLGKIITAISEKTNYYPNDRQLKKLTYDTYSFIEFVIYKSQQNQIKKKNR